MDQTRIIQGKIRDIQPNQVKPTLELGFKEKYRNALPEGKRAEISLNLNGKRWYGTVNSIIEKNPPYLHTHLKQDSAQGSKEFTCTQVFLDLGFKEDAILDFALEPDGTLRLEKVVSFGKWRAGNEPGNRENRSRSSTTIN